MSTGIWSAASGMIGQNHALDVAAANIANATTPGYRADRAIFRQTLVEAERADAATGSMRYAVTRSVEPDFTMGQLQHTGRPLDVAFRDKDGLFVVSTPQGERYTRAGSFRVSTNGTLTTTDGLTVLGPERRPIQVPGDAASVTFSQDGTLVVDGETTSSKLLMVTFQNPAGLEKEGSVLLRARPEAGRPRVHAGELEVSTLELSNASALTGMTRLVTATREFEMLTRVVEAFSSAERRAATDIMKR